MTTLATLRPSRFGPVPKDLSGSRFGRLVVLSFDRVSVSASGKSKWLTYLCRCDCGTVKSINAGALKAKRGATVSCGCFQREDVSIRASNMALGTPAERMMRRVFSQYKCKAKREKREFSLSFGEFSEILRGDCAYCGAPPENNFAFRGQSRVVKRGFRLFYSGIDRVDSSLGYTADNVVPCCKVCNIAKRDLSVGEFSSWVKRISAHLDCTGWPATVSQERLLRKVG